MSTDEHDTDRFVRSHIPHHRWRRNRRKES